MTLNYMIMDSPFLLIIIFTGECIVGLISTEHSKEKISKITKRDALPLTLKTVSQWYNDGDSKFKIIFLGEYDD